MSTHVWRYLEEYGEEKTDILNAVETVFESGQLILGNSVRAFEREFAGYHGLAHGVGVDNGTNAIVLGLQALGVVPGDEVITVSNTAAPTVVAIDAAGARPVFVDVRSDDYLMDVSQLEAAITPRTKCVVPVHMYGQCVNMSALLEVARRHGLRVLEDCAQAHGARHCGIPAGAMGDAGAYSFYPTKILGGYGDGGAVLTDDEQVAASLRRLRFYGMEEQYYVVSTPAHNSRLDEVQAEILRRKLRRLKGYIERRRAVARRYAEGLEDIPELVLPSLADGNDHVYYLYVARHPERERILEEMAHFDIRLNVSYRWPVHTMTGFAHLGIPAGGLPVTERMANEIFSLPMYAALPIDVQEKVIGALRSVLGA